ncbi:hypothetical protein OH76DRAFT_375214 [Lentinus brumalis]|uniref:DNA helicase Pif1-like 2B domain-containing protein n=1 Tax=Lentinus brumalis TaxID=2498619 RepID=A0A371DEI2_9APHY|nr:hypothetical protein OH76DRAFT_375214 [Polyporus brumalis]
MLDSLRQVPEEGRRGAVQRRADEQHRRERTNLHGVRRGQHLGGNATREDALEHDGAEEARSEGGRAGMHELDHIVQSIRQLYFPQVMLIKNIDETLVNGTMGKVIKFIDPTNPLEDEDGILGKPASKGKAEAKPPTSGLATRQLLPVVEFLQPGGARRTMVVMPDSWKVELPNGEVQVSRTQVRAITISRSARLASPPIGR